ncbi:MAG: HAMP domain-containing histidine kinase [Chloroflexi bacterium]|nr:MAG: HAMP domain-containing histidine kinase [Chloroflexota bacterium]
MTKEEFLGIASHELRTPLTTIKANIQLSMRNLKSAIQQNKDIPVHALEKMNAAYEMLGRADYHIAILNRLVGDMLDVSRIQSGKLQHHMYEAPCDLLAILCKAVQEQQKEVPNRRIVFEAQANEAVMIFADPNRIHQVITNYLSNALKYSAPEKPILVRLDLEGQLAHVCVRDEGQGLSEEEQKRVWECFYQSPEVRVLSGPGVGLGIGLSVNKAIIEQYHGQVGMSSRRGEGSTFWFTLPLICQE